jgi:predicted transposase YdaD
MLQMGLLTVEQIAQATGLSVDEVRKLSENI